VRSGQPGGSSSSRDRVKNLVSMSSRPALGPIRPAIQGTAGVVYPRIKRPEHEAEYSLPFSAEV
jgi:hypothetical protein